jgi:hypothetical protein
VQLPVAELGHLLKPGKKKNGQEDEEIAPMTSFHPWILPFSQEIYSYILKLLCFRDKRGARLAAPMGTFLCDLRHSDGWRFYHDRPTMATIPTAEQKLDMPLGTSLATLFFVAN